MELRMHKMKRRMVITLLILSPFTTSQINAEEINAGPIWNNSHAKEVCPRVCAENKLEWNGHWTTTVWGQMSVCTCLASSSSMEMNRENMIESDHVPMSESAPVEEMDVEKAPSSEEVLPTTEKPILEEQAEKEMTGQQTRTQEKRDEIEAKISALRGRGAECGIKFRSSMGECKKTLSSPRCLDFLMEEHGKCLRNEAYDFDMWKGEIKETSAVATCHDKMRTQVELCHQNGSSRMACIKMLSSEKGKCDNNQSYDFTIWKTQGK